MKLLDVFCGAGGAATGYHRAGFNEIVGVDIEPQPHYPFDFVQMDFVDLFTYPYPHYWQDADLIHASPPCQAYSDLAKRNKNADDHPRFIHALRDMLDSTNRDWVIENVEGAPLFERDKRKKHYGILDEWTAPVSVNGGGNCSVESARDAMGIDWMTKAELNEAIPPAYTEWIGRRLIETGLGAGL